MSEQITLFDEPLTPETLGDKLEEILEAAREKSGYYRLHESGMYEMMKGAPASLPLLPRHCRTEVRSAAPPVPYTPRYPEAQPPHRSPE